MQRSHGRPHRPIHLQLCRIAGTTVALALVALIPACTDRTSENGRTLNAAGGWASAATDLRDIPGDRLPLNPTKPELYVRQQVIADSSIQIDPARHTVRFRMTAIAPNQHHHASAVRPPTLTIPQGWQVNVVFHNDNTLHSAMLVTYDTALGAAAQDRHVIGRGAVGTTQSFLFKGRTPGRYAIVCATPGHRDGILAILNVSTDVDTPHLHDGGRTLVASS
ncbi:sulfocyanin-like copper-binding protein [Alicyclobacillus macrosporangiidus]|uniref:Sulfocyanin (SoxE) domain-containing protein n=1 Tax=Alicyclobacillus macrosporangiidus TaxID=392015 RepID=A0A1I7KX98_9BACL|nr:sulfocyanin-like copper-binding protein [Alicyclobacillus macrosporangiidus]SFV02047.1 Sulfocyanin (SoxE) domain-containing protein [Alicyclobacillus macrosporangiidus]